MRFPDGKVKVTSFEAIEILGSMIVGVLFMFLTWGFSILLVSIAWFGYYKYEERQESLMRQRAKQYQNLLDAEWRRLEPLQSFNAYLPNRHRLSHMKPLEGIIKNLSKMPRKYRDLWNPIEEDVKSHLRFVQEYNRQYIKVQRIRHSDFFNGQEYHSGHGFNDEQVKAILTNDYSNLIVAGPGAGKTRVLTSRVAFFIHHRGVPQEKTLVLAYNNSAAEEVRKRLKHRFGIEKVRVTTFHSIGLRILRAANQVARRNAVENRSDQVLGGMIDKLLEKNAEFQTTFLYYLRIWASAVDSSSVDSRHVAEQYRQKIQEPYQAIDGTAVKSLAERDIANFLIRHGIAYEYEHKVDWCDKDPRDPERTYCPDFYLPEYDVYLEHWSVNSNNKTPDFFTREKSKRYLKHMSWKHAQFEKHGKTLWETNHTMFIHGQLIPEIEKELREIGIKPVPLRYHELLKKAGLDRNASDVVRDSIINAVKTAKICGLTSTSLAEQVRDLDAQSRERRHEAQFILDLVINVFEDYELYLKEKNKIDFEDMINKAILVLDSAAKESSNAQVINSYDLILVDEFQDISYQRLRLLKELQRLNPECRLYCVGDDWQAIYGFAGSSAHYMIRFSQWFPSPARVDLTQNYRNPHDILDFGTEIIHKCSEKLDKNLQARETHDNQATPSPLVFKRIAGVDEFNFRNKQNESALKLINELVKEGVDPSEIMVLSRFNFGYADLQQACRNSPGMPVELRKEGKVVRQGVRFMSIHKSKGLEADYVFLLNVLEGLFGFPPEITRRFNFDIINPDLPKRMDEERRLFFVAATRAKKQCLIFVQEEKESEFLTENKYYRAHFESYVERIFEGRIVNETDKAYRIETYLSPSFRPVFWVPKSVIKSLSSNSVEPLQTFELDEWWYEKEGHKLNVSA